MERLKKYLKFAAFIPAIILVGAFVGCHAGAFTFSKPEPKPESQPTVTPQPPNQPASEKPPLFMSGTKSINNKGITFGLPPAGTNTPDLDVPVRTQPLPPQATLPPTPNAPKP